jgi:hypothetical protein
MQLARMSGHRDLRILQNVYYAPSVDELADRDAVARSQERRVEQLEEQVYFAQELLTALETGVKDAKSLREFRRLFAVTVEDSNFEG